MKPKSKRSDNRHNILLDAAAASFAASGYDGTTMRDIAEKCGMLAGSIYYHYPSKADLLVAVIQRGVDRICAAHDRLVSKSTDPWKRLEIALAIHIHHVTEKNADAMVMYRVLPSNIPEHSNELTKQRDLYEQRIRDLVDDLPLPPRTDRRLLRLMILGAVSWTYTWYRPGKTRPNKIAAQYCAFLRQPLTVQKLVEK